MKFIKEFKPLLKLLNKEKKKLIICSILLFICEFSYIVVGYLNGAAIEEITKMHLRASIIYLLIYFAYEVVVRLIQELSSNGVVKLESKLSRLIGYEAYCKALNMPAYAYEEMSSGEIINRITSDADSLSFTIRKLVEAFADIVSSVVLLFYIFYNSYIVGIVIMILMGILFLIMKFFNPRMKKAHSERKKVQDEFTSQTSESIRGVREIKTLGIKDNLITEMKSIVDNLYKKSADEMDLYVKFSLSTGVLRVIMEVGVFILCAILLYNGKVSMTFFIAMTYYVYRYMYLIGNLSDLNRLYQQVLVSLGRINEILLNKKYKDEEYGETKLKDAKGYIEFKDVSFAYPNEANVLNHFNLTLEPNKKIAIVGKSGQGKSTLFNLLTRVFDATEGKILIDGINIKDLDEQTLRKTISIIRQEPYIFNRTIKNNMRIVNKKISMAEIEKNIKKAYLDEYVNSLPKKYDTLLGEGGVNLSGGQKQRLAIARTLSKDTKIILFDEATSALDNNSQEYIKKTINNLVKDHTVVIVAHRLSTIKDADVIYVVHEGKIVGSGTHEELLKSNKIYKSLYNNETI
ncbi:MAG: ABC transporter ATP-binding protein [Bacilli bacterium]|nr:ABC transporter ATP-binding protein [Bacilli bacterium]